MEEERQLWRREKGRRRAQKARSAPDKPKPLLLPDFISLANLANLLGVNYEKFIRKVKQLGFENVNHDYILNSENAGLISMEFGHDPITQKPQKDGDLYAKPVDEEEKKLWPQRPPVVTLMGHVNHGKTTLLDNLRSTSIAATEHGGITQRIGAFGVSLSSGDRITFLDTPGHAAFTTIRRRGAKVTDIVILVVAADDGVMPQTIEAISHAKAVKVPMIVAINKIDKDGLRLDKLKQDLATNGVEIEEFGGDTQVVLISGKTGQGISDLEEAITSLSEILELRARIDGQVEGIIIESSKSRLGKFATILVQYGTLKVGSIIVAGVSWARVRSLRNEAGMLVPSVAPGMAAQVEGWRGQPEAGDIVLEATDESRAGEVVEIRKGKLSLDKFSSEFEGMNDTRRIRPTRKFEQALAQGRFKHHKSDSTEPSIVYQREDDTKNVSSFIIVADVAGSVEALTNLVVGIGNNEVKARIINSKVGVLSEFDIDFATLSEAHIIAFNVEVDPKLISIGQKRSLTIIQESIIYRVSDRVKEIMSKLLPPIIKHEVTGEAEVAEIFPIKLKTKKIGYIAGCRVKNGVITKFSKARVIRAESPIHQGEIDSLRSFKKDVNEIRKDCECGLSITAWNNFKVGDRIQCFREIVQPRHL